MIDLPGELEIRVHLVDGSSEKFHQHGAKEISDIFQTVRPRHFFETAILIFNLPHLTIAYPRGGVTHVEFTSAQPLEWAMFEDMSGVPMDDRRVTLIDERRFRDACKALQTAETPAHVAKPGETVHLYSHARFTNGASLSMETVKTVARQVDELAIMQERMAVSTFLLHTESGGLVLVNTLLIERFAIYPGATVLPATAIPMQGIAHG